MGQYSVRNGGHLVVRGVYHEKSADTLRGICLAGDNSLAIDATRFSYQTSAQAPLMELENFRGLFTIATSMLMPVDSTNTCRFEITGTGGGSALALNDLFWVHEPGITADKVWLNHAVPPLAGGLIGCNMNSPRQGIFRSGGFAFLDNLWKDGPDSGRADLPVGQAARQRVPTGGGAQTNIPDTELLRHLAPLREARVWLPGDVPAHATDLEIHRVMATGGSDTNATVEIRK